MNNSKERNIMDTFRENICTLLSAPDSDDKLIVAMPKGAEVADARKLASMTKTVEYVSNSVLPRIVCGNGFSFVYAKPAKFSEISYYENFVEKSSTIVQSLDNIRLHLI